MDEIRITGMRFVGRHGVFAEEQTLGQPFIVHLVMRLEVTTAAQSDALQDTIDYGDVFERVRSCVEGPPVRLIETLAVQVARDLLTNYESLHSVSVQIDKPLAPIHGVFDEVSVVVNRDRQWLEQ